MAYGIGDTTAVVCRRAGDGGIPSCRGRGKVCEAEVPARFRKVSRCTRRAVLYPRVWLNHSVRPPPCAGGAGVLPGAPDRHVPHALMLALVRDASLFDSMRCILAAAQPGALDPLPGAAADAPGCGTSLAETLVSSLTAQAVAALEGESHAGGPFHSAFPRC